MITLEFPVGGELVNAYCKAHVSILFLNFINQRIAVEVFQMVFYVL